MDINDVDDLGRTVLFRAAQNGNIKEESPSKHMGEIVKVQIPFVLGEDEVVHAYIRNGANFNIGDNKGRLPLHVAAYNGEYYIIFSLFEAERVKQV